MHRSSSGVRVSEPPNGLWLGFYVTTATNRDSNRDQRIEVFSEASNHLPFFISYPNDHEPWSSIESLKTRILLSAKKQFKTNSRQSAACCNALPSRRATPSAQQYGAGSPDAAPPGPSSWQPWPGSPGHASVSPTETRPTRIYHESRKCKKNHRDNEVSGPGSVLENGTRVSFQIWAWIEGCDWLPDERTNQL